MNKSNLKDQLKLYVITDSGVLKQGTLIDCTKAAIAGGITFLQYREKLLTGDKLKQEALALQTLCREANIPFIINDNVELAKEIGADGVHLGASDMELAKARSILGPEAIIGATAKTIEQALAAQEAGADYLGSGAIFGTTTKQDAKPMDMDTLRSITKSVPIPVVAIGGITGENVLGLKDTGIAGAAVVSGIYGQDNVKEATRDLLEKVGQII